MKFILAFVLISLDALADGFMVPEELKDAAVLRISYKDDKGNLVIEEQRIGKSEFKKLGDWIKEKPALLENLAKDGEVPSYAVGGKNEVGYMAVHYPRYMVSRFEDGVLVYKIWFWLGSKNESVRKHSDALNRLFDGRKVKKFSPL